MVSRRSAFDRHYHQLAFTTPTEDEIQTAIHKEQSQPKCRQNPAQRAPDPESEGNETIWPPEEAHSNDLVTGETRTGASKEANSPFECERGVDTQSNLSSRVYHSLTNPTTHSAENGTQASTSKEPADAVRIESQPVDAALGPHGVADASGNNFTNVSLPPVSNEELVSKCNLPEALPVGPHTQVSGEVGEYSTCTFTQVSPRSRLDQEQLSVSSIRSICLDASSHEVDLLDQNVSASSSATSSVETERRSEVMLSVFTIGIFEKLNNNYFLPFFHI